MKNLLTSLSEMEFVNLLVFAKKLWDNGICCPNKCGEKQKKKNFVRVCNAQNDKIRVASFAVHSGEEPPISGWNGAGNVFFSGCTMNCVFCQNWPISQQFSGKDFSFKDFSEKLLNLISKKVHNINLTTPDHYIYHFLKAIEPVREKINIPIAYNCSGFFSREALEIVLKFTDIFLIDYKYSDERLAKNFSLRKDYVSSINYALNRLFKENINWVEDDLGLLKKGVIVRHLVLPGQIENSLKILDNLADLQQRGFQFKLSLMSQYFPTYKSKEYQEINNIRYKFKDKDIIKDYILKTREEIGK